jgi:hypothetical protein
MGQVAAVVAILVIAGGGAWVQYRLSRGRLYSPLWMAFSATFAANLFIVTGLLGINLSRHPRFIVGTQSAVIWPQVIIGVALLPATVYLWRRALRSLPK